MATLSFIEDRLNSCLWVLNRRETAHAQGRGNASAIRKGEEFWTVECEWIFPREDRDKFLIQSAQLQNLEGGANLLAIHRPQRRDPFAFDASGAAGTVSAISVDTTDHEIDLTAGGEVGVGDMVSYTVDADGNRFLGEITSIISRPATNRAVFTTMPRAQAVHSTPAATLHKAHGLFQVDASSIQIFEPLRPGNPATIKANFKQVTI